MHTANGITCEMCIRRKHTRSLALAFNAHTWRHVREKWIANDYIRFQRMNQIVWCWNCISALDFVLFPFPLKANECCSSWKLMNVLALLTSQSPVQSAARTVNLVACDFILWKYFMPFIDFNKLFSSVIHSCRYFQFITLRYSSVRFTFLFQTSLFVFGLIATTTMEISLFHSIVPLVIRCRFCCSHKRRQFLFESINLHCGRTSFVFAF